MPTPNYPTRSNGPAATSPHTQPADTPTPAPAESRPGRVPGRSRLAVVGVAVLAALVVWAILAPLAGITLEAQQGTRIHVGAVSVLVASAAMALAGWGLLAILERRTVAARNIWTVVATIVCVTSMGSPLSSGIGTGAKLGLASLHLVVGAVVILGLRRTTLSAAERC